MDGRVDGHDRTHSAEYSHHLHPRQQIISKNQGYLIVPCECKPGFPHWMRGSVYSGFRRIWALYRWSQSVCGVVLGQFDGSVCFEPTAVCAGHKTRVTSWTAFFWQSVAIVQHLAIHPQSNQSYMTLRWPCRMVFCWFAGKIGIKILLPASCRERLSGPLQVSLGINSRTGNLQCLDTTDFLPVPERA